MPRDMARVLALICLLPLAILSFSCGDPRTVFYDKDKSTFRFDWAKRLDAPHDRSPEFERRFNRNVHFLQAKVQDKAVLDAVRIANNRDRDITAEQIQALDRKWRSSGDELPNQLTDEKCNESLKFFQRTFKGFAEIFVTNARGLNVCQTNKTTDYYQGNKDWWKQTIRRGKARHDFLKFDESAGVFAVPIYLPVRDPASGDVIGVAKALMLDYLLISPSEDSDLYY